MSEAVEWPPKPPAGATLLKGETSPPGVVRAEDNLLRSADARFKPLRGDLYRLSDGASPLEISRHYDAVLPGWRSEAPVEDRNGWRRDWTNEERLVSVALVADAQTVEAASAPVLIVQHTRR